MATLSGMTLAEMRAATLATIRTAMKNRLDAELGVKLGSRLTTWTYYAGGEVDTITISERDASDAETARQTIKHYTDGRPPEVS